MSILWLTVHWNLCFQCLLPASFHPTPLPHLGVYGPSYIPLTLSSSRITFSLCLSVSLSLWNPNLFTSEISHSLHSTNSFYFLFILLQRKSISTFLSSILLTRKKYGFWCSWKASFSTCDILSYPESMIPFKVRVMLYSTMTYNNGNIHK